MMVTYYSNIKYHPSLPILRAASLIPPVNNLHNSVPVPINALALPRCDRGYGLHSTHNDHSLGYYVHNDYDLFVVVIVDDDDDDYYFGDYEDCWDSSPSPF